MWFDLDSIYDPHLVSGAYTLYDLCRLLGPISTLSWIPTSRTFRFRWFKAPAAQFSDSVGDTQSLCLKPFVTMIKVRRKGFDSCNNSHSFLADTLSFVLEISER